MLNIDSVAMASATEHAEKQLHRVLPGEADVDFGRGELIPDGRTGSGDSQAHRFQARGAAGKRVQHGR